MSLMKIHTFYITILLVIVSKITTNKMNKNSQSQDLGRTKYSGDRSNAQIQFAKEIYSNNL